MENESVHISSIADRVGRSAIAVLMCPLPLRDTDKERIIIESAKRLVDVEPVYQKFHHNSTTSGSQYIPFMESKGIRRRNRKWHVVNDTHLQLTEIQSMGFTPILVADFREATEDINWYNTNAALEVTTRDSVADDGPARLRFNYYYGWLGAMGYRIRAYRCFFGTWYYFEPEWAS